MAPMTTTVRTGTYPAPPIRVAFRAKPTPKIPGETRRAQPRRHPFYWAAWVLTGDPGDLGAPDRAVIPPPGQADHATLPLWLYAVAGTAGVLLLAALAWRFRRRAV